MSDGGERTGGNGHVPDPDGVGDRRVTGMGNAAPAEADAALDALDAEPLDPDEAASGAALAADELGESMDERVEAVIDELGGVERRYEGRTLVFAAGGRAFAARDGDTLEAALDTSVLKAALRTPDAAPSPRGANWVAFSPATVDRYALDRAEAWVRFAHRRATGR
ncbi:MAG TPA: hypothetical protein VFY23_13510 [Candidatus Limnocylindrales bacterium]|nr:hypothetical protein [Candidatus Limnocylindrales bacterium]